MKSIYESIKSILGEGAATNPNAQGKEYTNPRMPGYYNKNKAQPATTAKPAASTKDTVKPSAAPAKPAAAPTPASKADTSSDAAKPGTWGNPKTSNPLIAKNREMVAKQQATGVNQAPGRAGPGSYEPAPKVEAPKNAATTEKPAKEPIKRPMNGALDSGNKPPKQASITPTKPATAKPAADNAPTSNDISKPAATDATTLADKQGKDTETKAAEAPSFSTTHPDISKAEKKAPTMQKRASNLPSDLMAKQIASTRDTVAKAFDADKGDDSDNEPKQAAAPKQAAETPAPKAEKPAEDGNTKTDADGRTYVRQKGVMGQPDTWNRSYASAGDFLNKIRGKGDVNGKVTAKEDYVNKTFGLSDNLAASIMEVMKKKESSAPRNDKEQDLAAQYGDPKRITHGDILVARGVIKPKKLKEGTMRNGKYVDDAPRPGTNEVPSPDEGYRGPGKPLYTPVDNKKPAKKAQSVQKESKDTPGNSYEHQCAIHVRSESFGEGRTVTTQHADPDRDGYIAWYDVMFEHGIEKYVPTSDLEILVSESHMHSKRKKTMREDAASDKLEKLKKLGQGADKEDPAQAAATPKPDTATAFEPGVRNALGIQGQATNVAGADALTGGANKPAPQAAATTPPPAPAQAAATPKPAQSDALSAIDGGSIGTSQMSYSKAPVDAKQGIAANAPAARVVSTSDGAKEAGYTQPNQRIAGFKSNARAREQAAGAAGVEAPMPNGGGKTIAQVRQALTNKPQASGTQAPVQKPQAAPAPAQQASATPAPSRIAGSNAIAKGAPAGETPEDRARKIAAAKAKQGSYVQQGMVGSDF
jgi:hypothetical protein